MSFGEGNGEPLQYSFLDNSMDRGACQATVHGVTKSQTRLGIHAHLVSLLPHSRASSCFSLALTLLILMWVPCVSHVKNHTFHLFSLCNFAILKHFLGLSVCIIMVPKRRPHPNPKTCEYDISCCKGELTLQMD